ncbi:hypothetical protein BDW42DRAFT_43894 [Aspergillus taichungensis]|uniref:Uncharacterized protein n=1 Tax=Aspergillus taichungensis TaxID=482145 RepID=A0A2J5HE56_9EURO|nr:hypothetical protein BDW42DRAFT_43894 [Aspergillus taichungensis]
MIGRFLFPSWEFVPTWFVLMISDTPDLIHGVAMLFFFFFFLLLLFSFSFFSPFSFLLFSSSLLYLLVIWPIPADDSAMRSTQGFLDVHVLKKDSAKDDEYVWIGGQTPGL